VPPEYLDFFFVTVQSNVVALSKHVNGCRIIQRIFENFSQNRCKALTSEIFKKIHELSTDIYGNYVISHVL